MYLVRVRLGATTTSVSYSYEYCTDVELPVTCEHVNTLLHFHRASVLSVPPLCASVPPVACHGTGTRRTMKATEVQLQTPIKW